MPQICDQVGAVVAPLFTAYIVNAARDPVNVQGDVYFRVQLGHVEQKTGIGQLYQYLGNYAVKIR
jgi:hypothetical protein